MNRIRSYFQVLVMTIVVGSLLLSASAKRAVAEPARPAPLLEPDDQKKKDSSTEKETKHKKSKPKKKGSKIRWGQRPDETDEAYDKRWKRVRSLVKKDPPSDLTDGTFNNGHEEIFLYTFNVKACPFIVRTEISPEFTADLVLYMENLHREWGKAYAKLLGLPSNFKEKMEIIVFSDRKTYIANGGSENSLGYFMPWCHFLNDRGPLWPARHCRLVQFTSGVTDFSKWPKDTLKHESSHMEMQMRLGFTLFRDAIGIPVDCPRWWNEGHAACFENWDFEMSVDENFASIPTRGRYAPFIRRMYGTDAWKDFRYLWEADTWDFMSGNVYFNYCRAWSLVGYMMNSGIEGRKQFRKIFNLAKTVGADEQQTYKGDRKRNWSKEFPKEMQHDLEKGWNAWVEANCPKEGKVIDERYMLIDQGVNPDVTDRLELLPKDEKDSYREWLEKEKERRREKSHVER